LCGLRITNAVKIKQKNKEEKIMRENKFGDKIHYKCMCG